MKRHGSGGRQQQVSYPPYWDSGDLQRAVKRGQAFK
jgi:hypothetical protein